MSQQRDLELLRQAAAALERGGATPCANPDTSATSTTTTAPSTSGGTNIASAVRSIFQPYTNRAGYRPNVSSRRSNPTASGSGRCFWTHRFCVLGRISDTVAPTREEKDVLYKANLGEKKLVMEKNSNVEYFKRCLEEQYPKLIGIGGFELLRTQARSRFELEIIRMPPGGYNVNFLANQSNLGQAVCFVRPIQTNISLQEEDDNEEGILEDCLRCHQQIPLRFLRDHAETCEAADKKIGDENTLTADEIQPDAKKRRLSIDQPICGYSCRQRNASADEPTDSEEACPVCNQLFPSHILPGHASSCGDTEAVAESIAEKASKTPDEEMKLVYETFSSQIELSVIRRKFLTTAMEQIEDISDEDWGGKIKVRFIGEEGIDVGGLSREFFTMLFKESPVFEESMLSVQADLLRKQHYLLLGRMTAMALLSGHPGPKCLEPHIVEYLMTEKFPDMSTVSVEIINRQDVLHAIKQIQEISTENEVQINFEISDLLATVNFTRRVTADNKMDAVAAVKDHFVFYRCLPSLLQYMEGLNINGVLEIVKKYPEAKKYFVKSTSTTASEIMDLFSPIFSANDDQKAEEEIVIYNMHQFLKNVERGRVTTQHLDPHLETESTVTVKMEQVLQSFIGCQHVVSNMKGTITFDHTSIALSTVNTCAPSINFSNLKDITNYDNFEALMLNIVYGTYGFGIV